MGALSATHKHRDAFEPLLDGFSFVPFNNVERLRAAVGDGTAAVIVEIVQGEGGVRLGDAAFSPRRASSAMRTARCSWSTRLQTGFCRTGKFFASEHHGVRPDVLCLAKAMGGRRADGCGAGG